MQEETGGDEAAELLAGFAAELRELKHVAGDPTLALLSDKAGISKSVISEALSGKKLPTERTVSLLAEALEADRAEWVARRNKVAYEMVTGASGDATIPSVKSSRRALVFTAAISAVIAAALTSGIWVGWMMLNPPPQASGETQADETMLEEKDGVDPMRTRCREDSVIAASDPRLDGEVQVQLLYSNKCMAIWGRVTRYDGKSAGNSISMRVYPATDPESLRGQERSAIDTQSIYTPLILEPNVDARVCGIATVTIDGNAVELAPPICA